MSPARDRRAFVRIDSAEELAEGLANAVGSRLAALELLTAAAAYLRRQP